MTRFRRLHWKPCSWKTERKTVTTFQRAQVIPGICSSKRSIIVLRRTSCISIVSPFDRPHHVLIVWHSLYVSQWSWPCWQRISLHDGFSLIFSCCHDAKNFVTCLLLLAEYVVIWFSGNHTNFVTRLMALLHTYVVTVSGPFTIRREDDRFNGSRGIQR